MSGHSSEGINVLAGIHQQALDAATSVEPGVALQAAQQAAQEAVRQFNLDKHETGVGKGLVAFVFGYAVDVYYGVLDRISGKIGAE